MFKRLLAVLLLGALITPSYAVPLKKKAVEGDAAPAAAKDDQSPAPSSSSSQKLIPLAGHSIKIDKSLSDWKGDLPPQDDSWMVDQGEYIWRDAQGDDKGPGAYTYPTNAAFGNCADIREVRVTWDSKNVYIMIKCRRPGDWWAPYRLVGIHKENSAEPFTTLLAQGSPEDRNPEEGCLGNIKVAPELACQYVLGLSSTWKMYLWNAKNKLIGKRTGKEDDTPGLRMDDVNWSAVEVALPIEIIGNPAGQTWKFIIGTGSQENDYLRSVCADQSEWHGGGGDGDDKEPGACPSLFDLAGASKAAQEKDLAGYKRGGSNSDSSGFTTIRNSYITVKFADRPAE